MKVGNSFAKLEAVDEKTFAGRFLPSCEDSLTYSGSSQRSGGKAIHGSTAAKPKQ
ncbi:MAG: hypothetical protein WCQ50_04050 [Spirochaetota bacterium]